MNFLPPRTYKIRVRASLAEVSAALDVHINGLPVRKNWLDFRNSLLASSYVGNGAMFTIDQRINMGRNEIRVHANGDGKEEGEESVLQITYVVRPRWLRYFLWFFVGMGMAIGLTLITALVKEGINEQNFFFLFIPVVFPFVTLIINYSYQSQIDRVHREVRKALKSF